MLVVMTVASVTVAPLRAVATDEVLPKIGAAPEFLMGRPGEGAALRPLAGLRHGGDGALLSSRSARGGDDQVEPAEDHCHRYELALSHRA